MRKKSRHTLNSGIKFLWDSGSTNSMINRKHINTYKYKLRSNKAEYRTAACPYKTTHDVKVPFSMSKVSIRKTITHSFYM